MKADDSLGIVELMTHNEEALLSDVELAALPFNKDKEMPCYSSSLIAAL
jgi:hypothetical protein